MVEVVGRRYSGRSAQEWSAARRERLLSAALELFSSDGYRATSIERLCATAKVSTRHFYQEFPNKEAVLVAVHEQGVQRGMAEAAQMLGALPPAPIQQRLAGAMRAYLHTVVSDPRQARIAFVEVVGVSAAVEQRRMELREAIVGLVAAEGMAAVARGEIEPRNFRFLGMALIGAVNGTVYDWVLQDPRPPADELAESIIELALNLFGIAP
jgi:AcrR family transcriptional regulator